MAQDNVNRRDVTSCYVPFRPTFANCPLILQPPVNSSSLSFLTLRGRAPVPRSQFPALASDWRTPLRDTRFPWQRLLVECRIAVSARSDGVAPGGHRFAAVAAHLGLRASAFFRTPPKTNIAFLCYNSSSFVLLCATRGPDMPSSLRKKPARSDRFQEALAIAKEAGLLRGAKTEVVRGRMPRALVEKAKTTSGARSDTELIE